MRRTHSYGYVTNTQTKLILVTRDVLIKEPDIKNVSALAMQRIVKLGRAGLTT